MITNGIVIAVALLMGFRPSANLGAWLAALGVIALFTLALTWMAVVFGLIGKTPAGANGLSLIFQLILPFTSSAFARPASMPAGLRWFAEYQPFTPVIDTARGLLLVAADRRQRRPRRRLAHRPHRGRLPLGGRGL